MTMTLKDAVEKTFPEQLALLRELVAVPSVRGTPLPDAPYGKEPACALDVALDIAERLGFQTTNIDNIIGYAEYPAEKTGDTVADSSATTEPYLGIFGHVDVVPLGEGWTYDPLGGEISGGKIYGRGVLDNKGPILANLFALYLLKEAGVTFPYPVRVVFGTNEETGFGCIKHYLEKEPAPFFGWTPDNKWPVVYGERGRAVIRWTNRGELKTFTDFINDHILSAPANGQNLGLNFSDEDFGEMIVRGHRLGTAADALTFQVSLSYPTGRTIDAMMETLKVLTPASIDVEVTDNWDPVLKDLARLDRYVEPLSAAYAEVTEAPLAPTTTTGGTYAKFIPNIVAYGPSFPGQNGIAHLPDEWMDLDDLKKITEIYATALLKLSPLAPPKK